jgi:chromosome segregation protein
VKLKNLEIKGFKSFADRTIVNFDENITGIVGPNGCGKSNIVDSIRWVIGEQKISHLRSENLDSLVFNGSKSRSASGLAEVSLTFENTRNLLPTEFNTVTITRKFYKSGESEYRLNDVQCRLKDIQNLFIDTGISTDSYAIIELGMVDDLIKDKDNSRRRMLEQAAGISIYKTRKKEAAAKLEATEMDLARIEDLLFEINNQLKALESQAKKAEKYHEVKKEYREISIELAKAALEGFNLSYRDLVGRQDSETDSRLQLEAAIAKDEADLEKEKLSSIEQENELHRLQHEFNHIQQALQASTGEKNLSRQRIEHLQEKEKGLQDFLQRAGLRREEILTGMAHTEKMTAEEEKALSALFNDLGALRAEADAKRTVLDEKRRSLDEQRKDHQQVQQLFFTAERKVAVAESTVQNTQKTLAQMKEESMTREQQKNQQEELRQIKEKELRVKQVDLEQLQHHHEKTREQILQSQAQLDDLQNKLAAETRRLDARKNEYDLLKSMIDSMEGYPESVKFLHKNPEWNLQAPILSDVIYVKEDFRMALENVLEPYLNYYIVENLQDGLAAVHLLDGQKKGKANFFLLDRIAADHSNFVPAPHPAGLLPALEVIEVDPKYRRLAEWLLQHVYIADSEDALQNSNGFVVIEKQGKYVKGKYSLTGGSTGLIEGKKIGRIKNMEKLQDEISELDFTAEKLRSDIQSIRNEVIAFNEELRETAIRDTEKEIQLITTNIFSIQNKLENIHLAQAEADKKSVELETYLEQTHASSADEKNNLSQYSTKLDNLGQQMQETTAHYQEAESVYNEANERYNEFNITVTRQQSKIQSLRQELEFKMHQLEDLELQVKENEGALDDTKRSILQTRQAAEEIEQKLLQLLQEKDRQETILNESDRAFHVLRNQLSEKETSIRQQVRRKEQHDLTLADIKDKLNELKLQLTGMKERMHVEFRIDIEAILGEARQTETPLEELQERSDRLKRRLENLGDINPTAIEAFTEMKKRFDFITEQKNDLVNARESLLRTIQEVEATANEKFTETFEKVRQNFQKVFQTLFTEDDLCDLVLESPENIAESGIDVIAKPKGKRPTSLTQLSGGERTLTATALLFAIYLIKPAPFCILDEVDAPLDDANVGKFTHMIRQFSGNSQFIIVTHNKMTMSAVDVIYGVTMQEPGVSKLVPVDFRSLEN